MNITLTLMADHLISNSNIFLFSKKKKKKTPTYFFYLKFGVLALNSYLKLSSKVKIFGLFRFYTISISSCETDLSLSHCSKNGI